MLRVDCVGSVVIDVDRKQVLAVLFFFPIFLQNLTTCSPAGGFSSRAHLSPPAAFPFCPHVVRGGKHAASPTPRRLASFLRNHGPGRGSSGQVHSLRHCAHEAARQGATKSRDPCGKSPLAKELKHVFTEIHCTGNCDAARNNFRASFCRDFLRGEGVRSPASLAEEVKIAADALVHEDIDIFGDLRRMSYISTRTACPICRKHLRNSTKQVVCCAYAVSALLLPDALLGEANPPTILQLLDALGTQGGKRRCAESVIDVDGTGLSCGQFPSEMHVLKDWPKCLIVDVAQLGHLPSGGRRTDLLARITLRQGQLQGMYCNPLLGGCDVAGNHSSASTISGFTTTTFTTRVNI